ncbi:unnamed protein product [Lactuca saligna]|uniref:Glucose/ribitol dehydrogenase n=1 Tax=Lactuca saligna TaxID=75948 RepID=A0AA35YI59_LACSI|nr:unnamed protein product [Lactuca saligna]
MEEKRYAVVTGGNKGIGFEICPRLAKFIEIHFKKLDILVNNAAEGGVVYVNDRKFRDGGGFVQVMDKNLHLLTNVLEEPYELAEECLKTNYYGTKRITEALIPLLQLSKSPRIVNVTSAYGNLHWFYNEKLKEELIDIENLTEEKIKEIIQGFLRDFKAGKLQENGWPLTVAAYKVSKAVLNAYTRLMARKFQNILVNCVHPGYCVTDMTSNTGVSTAEEGAKGPVMAALLPDEGPSGAYFDKMERASFTLIERAICIIMVLAEIIKEIATTTIVRWWLAPFAATSRCVGLRCAFMCDWVVN